MKIQRIALVLVTVLIVFAAAASSAEQQLPGVEVFSPGLVRLSEKMREDPAVHMEAALSVSDAFYVRDTSVLSAMLEGTTIVYDGAQGEHGPVDRIAIVREEETLFDAWSNGDMAAVNGEGFALDGTLNDAGLQTALDFVQTTAILERAPLAEVERVLLSLDAGEELLAGYAVVQPFVSVQTMSDDGARLTRINLSGSVAREGEVPWVIEGYLKQPAGRAPKDTFELTAKQDEKNWLELSYSSTRQSEITKKNKNGKASVDTHVKVAGEIGGYRISERLTSYLRNTWTADGENLDEKIVVNMTLEHSDNTPGREMQRLNRAEGKMRHEIRLTTQDAGNDVICLTDAVTLSAVMDENTVLDAAAQAEITVGGEAAAVFEAPVQAEAGRTVPDALADGVRGIARSAYKQLGENTQKKILEGLE